MRIGIVGAGATGLTAAYYLAKAGHKVTVLEAEDYCGGIAGAVDMGKTRLERFYHHIFTGDSDLISLAGELGLSGRLKWHMPKNAVYINKKLYPFTTPMDLVRFSEIPLIQRLRLGLLVLKAGNIKDYKALDKISASEWIRSKAGSKAYGKLWEPLLKSKFDDQANEISAVWLWNKLKLRGRSREKPMQGEMLGYMEGSFSVLYDTLRERINELDGRVLTGNRVHAVLPEGNGRVRIVTSNDIMAFNRLLVTASPEILLETAGEYLPLSYRNKLSMISYKANICAVLKLSRPLSPWYWITVAQNDFPFVLLIEHTSIVPWEEYGSHIVYLSRYLDAGNPLYTASDNSITDLFAHHVQRIFPSFNPAEIKSATVYRTRYAQPVVVKNYSKLLVPHETPLENLYLACMAQIYPEDRGQNYAVRMGREAALLMTNMKQQEVLI